MIRGLIFDFDGLILDTEGPEYRSWQGVFQDYGCNLVLSEWARGIGRGVDESPFDPYAALEAACGHALDRAVIRRRRNARYEDLLEGETVLPGVKEYMVAARDRGFVLGVASSSSHAWVDGHLNRLGLRSFIAAVVCADDTGRAKPHPAVYQAVLARLQLLPEEAIAFEDSPAGVAAAHAAGLTCVAVPNSLTCRLPLEHADLRLTSLADMPLDTLVAELTLLWRDRGQAAAGERTRVRH
jgi:HAD superfamily hydrolase (TIGR01509 family)